MTPPHLTKAPAIAIKAALGTVAALAVPAKRSEALAGLFLISYLGLTLPVVGIGVATLFVPAPTVMTWFAALLLVLLAGLAALARRRSTNG